MESKILFYEKQQFRQLWLWLLFLVLYGFLFYKIIFMKDFGTAHSLFDFFPIIIIVIITLLFWFLKLETKIKDDGIYIRFFPVIIKPKFYSWDALEKAYVKKYNPLLDYGGWGIRFGAYNVSGNIGLQLIFKTGKQLLIGTQEPDKIEAILNSKFFKK